MYIPILIIVGTLHNKGTDLTKSPEMESMLVTLSVFSGRPDPQRILQSNNSAFQEIKNMLPPPPGGTLQSILGYRGFVVRGKFGTVTIKRESNPVLEKLLFNACEFPENLRQWVFGDLRTMV